MRSLKENLRLIKGLKDKSDSEVPVIIAVYPECVACYPCACVAKCRDPENFIASIAKQSLILDANDKLWNLKPF